MDLYFYKIYKFNPGDWGRDSQVTDQAARDSADPEPLLFYFWLQPRLRSVHVAFLQNSDKSHSICHWLGHSSLVALWSHVI